jgi:adenosylcobinamide kinase/adenosylcobinamide-phosphate guanylyltransferase
MQARIARHQADRAVRVPGMRTVEEPLAMAQAIQHHSAPDTLLVVDCLTLWLTNLLMPMHPKVLPASEPNQPLAIVSVDYVALLLEAIAAAPGPLVLVGNEIGLGVIPMGAEVRAFVDALGRLNQQVAEVCARVTLMAAGLPLTLKAPA